MIGNLESKESQIKTHDTTLSLLLQNCSLIIMSKILQHSNTSVQISRLKELLSSAAIHTQYKNQSLA